ncbi:PSP1-domain-containing protein [Sporormia fimetaria CBS 119925]|uniref:PSP1-domain-containing protein n=1 Tax=Sporormia fimetaria CBS 119925 TaxID=1340428 RepID=A0A6A6VG61_9PLEO|nr:PSP1-domain-containing protein [Sporormia fimetaria CBS 119925]
MNPSTSKGGLNPMSSLPEKAKAMRRPTPDNESLVSSEDEQLATRGMFGTRRPSNSWLHDIQRNRKYSMPTVSLAGGSSQPTTPAADLPAPIGTRPGASTSSVRFNTTSFTAQANHRFKEVLPSPTTAQPSGETADTFAFHSPVVMKSGRSQSYSIGQPDAEQLPYGHRTSSIANTLRPRHSRPSLAGEGLAQLPEDDQINQGAYFSSYQFDREANRFKQLADLNARHRSASTASPSNIYQARKSLLKDQAMQASQSNTETAILELDDSGSDSFPEVPGFQRRHSEWQPSMMNRRASPPTYGQQGDMRGSSAWGASSFNAEDQLGRRHSIAFPSQPATYQPPGYSYNEEEEQAEAMSPGQAHPVPEAFDAAAYFSGRGPIQRAVHASAVSAAHPAPIIADDHTAHYSHPTGPGGRQMRRYFVVGFKCNRADIYYILENTGLELSPGQLVVVEGDRGWDLGQILAADVSMEEAKRQKAAGIDEHFRWLTNFSQYSVAGANAHNMLGALARAVGHIERAKLTSMGGQQEQNDKPKMIKRLAQPYEVEKLREKEGGEAKAKRMAAQKAAEHKLPMEILDAEFQADMGKLTLYYYAESYVNFNPLVVDIFKQFKIRIWMSAVNPASVVNPAASLQPPSVIGPGAILPNRSQHHTVGPGFGPQAYRSQSRGGGHNGGHGGGHARRGNQGFADNYQQPYGYGQNSYGMTPQGYDYQGWPVAAPQQQQQQYGGFMGGGAPPAGPSPGPAQQMYSGFSTPTAYGAWSPPTQNPSGGGAQFPGDLTRGMGNMNLGN